MQDQVRQLVTAEMLDELAATDGVDLSEDIGRNQTAMPNGSNHEGGENG